LATGATLVTLSPTFCGGPEKQETICWCMLWLPACRRDVVPQANHVTHLGRIEGTKLGS